VSHLSGDKMRRLRLLWVGLVLSGFIFFSACEMPKLAILGAQATVITETATIVLHPSPTSDFNTVNSPVCKLAEWDANLTTTTQGNQMAWSPKMNDLAFLLQRSAAWYLGDLAITSGPNFTEARNPVPDAAVYGDPTWSPDASQIGFVALRQADSVYTVIVTQPGGSVQKDLFPGKAAKTDTYASSKSILSWPSLGLMTVEITCGIDCIQTAQLDPASGNKILSPDVRRAKDRQGGSLTRNVLVYDKAVYPSLIEPNWSHDGKKLVYFTENGEVWVIDVTARIRYPVDLNRVGQETKWSFDDRFLAVRTDRWVTVYAWSGCEK